MRVIFAICLVAFPLSYSYIIDGSCSKYSDMVIKGMKSAFDLGQAGSDIFTITTPKTNNGVWQAQQDLISYIFGATLTGNDASKNREEVSQRFTSLLKFDPNKGDPETTPDQSTYASLTSDKLIVFCDYSRFKENQDCSEDAKPGSKPGDYCDTLLDYSGTVSDVYTYCNTPNIDEGIFYNVSYSVLAITPLLNINFNLGLDVKTSLFIPAQQGCPYSIVPLVLRGDGRSQIQDLRRLGNRRCASFITGILRGQSCG